MYSKAFALMTLLTAGCIASAGTDMSVQNINQWEERNCSKELALQFAAYLLNTTPFQPNLRQPPDTDKCCGSACKNEKIVMKK